VLLLGVALFVAAWQKWIPIGEPDPTSVFARQLSDLKGAYERTETDPVELKTRLSAVAGGVEAYPDLAARARFYLGSGYVRLAEVTPELDEARGYWTLAHQHFKLVNESQLRDPVEAAKYAFRFNKARAAVGLAPDTRPEDLAVMINILSTPQPGEDSGETQRLIAELLLRMPPQDPQYLSRAKRELSVYVQSGLATPAANLARGRLRLGQLFVQTRDYEQARKVLSEVGADAPAEVRCQAYMELARVLLADGVPSEAVKELEKVRAVPGVPPALSRSAAYQLGVCKRQREPDAAARMFEEAAKGDGPEARAAAIQLADLHLHSPDPARHRAAVELLAGALKGVQGPAEYDASLVLLNEVQAVFELAVTALLADGAYEAAVGAADLYAAVSAPGRFRERRAEVLDKWGDALQKSLEDPKPKFRAAAAELAALAADQPRTEGKLDFLRRSALISNKAQDHKAAAALLESAVQLPEIPEAVLLPVWVELANAKLAAGDFKDVWRIFNIIMSKETSALSTATRYRLARQFVDSRHPGLAELGRALFEQIAKQSQISSEEREFHERALTELANSLIRENKFADAEDRLRFQLKLYSNGPEAGLARLLLGVCLLHRAGSAPVPEEAVRMRTEALGLFKKNVAACDALASANGKLTDREAWLRLQSGLRVLQAYQQLGTDASARNLLSDAYSLRQRQHGTVEELVILSLMYHALRQLNDTRQAQEIRETMLDVFKKLPPSAFTQPIGEYSREYWQTVWFPPEKK
jgi:TolA-binding protein